MTKPRARQDPEARSDARAFGAYIRMLRESAYGTSRGKSLRQLARETGVAPSVLSRGERGLQDLRQAQYIERLAPHLGVRPSVMKRVASLITRDDLDALRPSATASGTRPDGASRVLWTRLARELDRLRGAPPETLEAVLSYLEFLGAREPRAGSAR